MGCHQEQIKITSIWLYESQTAEHYVRAREIQVSLFYPNRCFFKGPRPSTKPDISSNAGSELVNKITEAEEGLSLTL